MPDDPSRDLTDDELKALTIEELSAALVDEMEGAERDRTEFLARVEAEAQQQFVHAYDSTVPPVVLDQPDHYRLAGPDGLQWAMRLYARAQREHDEISHEADLATAQITRWYNDRVTGPQRIMAAMSALIEPYAKRMRESGRKTLQTPFGTIATRGSDKPRVVIEQEAVVADQLTDGARAVLDNLRREFPLLTFSVSADSEAIRRVAIQHHGKVIDRGTGAVLAGVTMVPREVKVAITAADEAPWVANPARGIMGAVASRAEETRAEETRVEYRNAARDGDFT